jgi:hypothetical protein
LIFNYLWLKIFHKYIILIACVYSIYASIYLIFAVLIFLTKMMNKLVFKLIGLTVLLQMAILNVKAQTPVPMATQPSLTYLETFDDIANWTFAAGLGTAGTGIAPWQGFAATSTTVTSKPNPTLTTHASLVFASAGTSGGIQKPGLVGSGLPTGSIGLQATGTTDNTNAVSLDLVLNFSNATPGTLSFDGIVASNLTSAFSGAGNRYAQLVVYTSIDNVNWTLLPLPNNIVGNNNVAAASPLIIKNTNIPLPSNFANAANARIRFYGFNGFLPGSGGAAGTAGNRPKLGIDSVRVTAASACANPITASLSSSLNITCAGQLVNLNASSSDANATFTYTANTSATQAGLASTSGSSVFAAPLSTTTYTVTANSGSCAATSTVLVTVNPLPNISVTPVSATVCAGSSETINATCATCSSISWAPATYLDATFGNSVISTPLASTTYTATGVDINGCAAVATAAINYISGINLSFSPSMPVLNCVNDSVTITASGAASYVWAPSTGLNNTTSATVLANPTSTTIYTVTGSAGSCNGSATVQVTVNANPLPVVSFVSSSITACNSLPFGIKASGASTYSWSPSSLNGALTDSVYTNPVTSSVYTVTAASTEGCITTATFGFTVNNLPTVIANAAPSVICATGSSTLNATGALSYDWGMAGTGTPITVTPTNNATYTVTGTDINGCTRTATVSVEVLNNQGCAVFSFNAGNTTPDVITNCNTNIASAGNFVSGNNNGTATLLSTTSPNNFGSAGFNIGAACKVTSPTTLDIATSTYFEFEVTPSTGYIFSLDKISLFSRSTSTGPGTITIHTSADNFATALATQTLTPSSVATYLPFTFTLPAVNNAGDSTLKIRIYGSNANGNPAANTVNWRLDDIKVCGTTAPLVSCTPPTITATLSNTIICEGSSTMLTVTGASTHSVLPANSSISTGLSTYNLTPITTTIYTITAAGTGTCFATTTVSVTVLPVITSTNTVYLCSGDLPYQFGNNVINAAGVYYDTIIASTGCDSIIQLQAIVSNNSSDSVTVNLCSGDLPYFFLGNTYTTAGTYTAFTINTNGCDSIITLNINVSADSTYTVNQSVCSNQLPYMFAGNTYSIAGTYTINNTNAAGCDSNTILNLTVNTVANGVASLSLCNYQLPFNYEGFTVPAAGVYTVPTVSSSAGCDSSVILTVTVNNGTSSQVTNSICASQLPYTYLGTAYTMGGTYTVSTINAAGCDSIITYTLNVNNASSNNISVTQCSNQLPYTFMGNTYTMAGTYSIVTTNAAGCDSTIVLTLNVNNTSTNNVNTTICSSQLPYTYMGNSYTMPGTYTVNATNSIGCDSVITFTLSVVNSTSGTASLSLCNYQLPFTYENVSITAAGVYTVPTVNNSLGCDSSVILTVTVNNGTSSQVTNSICASQLPYTYLGTAYTMGGTYTVATINAAGCDSIITYTLNVNNASSNNISVTKCSNQLPYTFMGNIYTMAGTYTIVTTNAAGCDSNIVLTLNVNNTSSNNVNTTICSSQLPYTYMGNSYTMPGTYTVNATNSIGCDSVITFTLTVVNSTSGTASLSLCNYQLPFTYENVSITAAGVYTVPTVNNSLGCDSSVILTVTVNNGTSSQVTNSICASQLPYTYLGTAYTMGGTYIVSTINAAGCDSIITYTLVVNNASSSTVTANVTSNNLPYVWNGNNYNTSGMYTYTTTNAAGCDSVVTLNLTVTQATAILVNIKALLAGPYMASTMLMHDSLRMLNLIPTTEPYTGAANFTHVGGGGTETTTSAVLSVSGNNAIVDWVFVQIRSAVNPAMVIATQSALLQRDGDVVSATDGTSPVSFVGLPVGAYNISIKHRNHLGVTTGAAVSLSATATMVDFTSTTNSLYTRPTPNNNAPTLIVGTKRLLYGGECKINAGTRFVNYSPLASISDKIALSNFTGLTGTVLGYNIFDLNLNGKANFNGINADRFVQIQTTGGSNNITIMEQTPN